MTCPAWLSGRRPLRQPVAVAVENQPSTPEAGDSAPSPMDEMLVKTLPQTPGAVGGFTVPSGRPRPGLLCHLSVVVGMALIGWKHFGDLLSGMAAATFYLLLPYTYMLTPNSALGLADGPRLADGVDVWGVFCYRRPTLSGSSWASRRAAFCSGADAAGVAKLLLEAWGGRSCCSSWRRPPDAAVAAGVLWAVAR